MANAATDTLLVINNSTLELNYVCKTNQVSYSIADFVGNIVTRGNYNCVKDNKLNIQDIPNGPYMLCIIDGDSLTKLRFVKN